MSTSTGFTQEKLNDLCTKFFSVILPFKSIFFMFLKNMNKFNDNDFTTMRSQIIGNTIVSIPTVFIIIVDMMYSAVVHFVGDSKAQSPSIMTFDEKLIYLTKKKIKFNIRFDGTR